jgi:hypothetical protein
MTAAEAAAARLVAAIRADRGHLGRLHARLLQAQAGRPWAPDDATLYLVAMTVDHYYTATESILERIARTFEGLPGAGPRWHRELLSAMANDIPGVRIAVLSGETSRLLHDLLGFRHFIRHAYGADLDAERLGRVADRLAAVHPLLSADLDRFEAALGVPATGGR